MFGKINDLESKQKASISFFLSFTLFVFGPLELYLDNKEELWFGIMSLTPIIIIGGSLSFLSLYFLMSNRSSLNKYIKATLFGIAISTYLQGNFLVINYGLLDGSAIEWKQYTIWQIISLVLWTFCILASIIATKKIYGKFNKFTFIVSTVLSGVQVIALIVLIAISGVGGKDKTVLTTEGIFDVSTTKNIAVFIVDSMDTSYFNQALETYPELNKTFNDFTYYKNVIGMYPSTKGAIPYILTGDKYLNGLPYNEYIEKAWRNNPLALELKKNNFNCGVYTSSSFISTSADLINMQQSTPQIKSYETLYKEYAKLVLFKYSPDILKKYFVLEFDTFDNLKDSSQDVYSMDTRNIYKLLKNSGINPCKEKIFRVYHYEGSHLPFTLDENLNEVSKSSAVKQTKGALKIVEDYIKLLKENNCYDNSMIVVMADHGATELHQKPTLLIKYPKQHHNFNISDVEASYSDLMPTLISQICRDYKKYGESLKDIQKGNNRKREFYYYEWDDSWDKQYLPDIKKYTTTKTTNELGDNEFSGKIYTKNGIVNGCIPRKYKWEQRFSFLEKDDRSAIVKGISPVEKDFAWSLGEKTELKLNINKNPKGDVKLILNIPFILGEKQRIKFFINNKYICEKDINSTEHILTVVIPKDFFRKGQNVIVFQYPDARSPQSLGTSTDTRVLAVAYTTMVLSQKNLYQDILDIKYNGEISFKPGGQSSQLQLENWYTQEEDGIWTSESSTMTFYTESASDIQMNLYYNKFLGSGSTTIYVNGEKVKQINGEEASPIKIVIPKGLLNAGKNQLITFETLNAKSPKELGLSEDQRKLGIFVTKIAFKITK
ncbi:sulfatase-like hydrolase/transferase [Clostridium aminobutyricum]|uniref:Sulfatase-like hydrolase/transferase n=1 Tax=Clostridium aminobutyricum TaxID=33953 RepID=A0A939IHP2_CLOAM|nr:sulfatase-like hydrolase/transferase [Clostridium aminobutyricum]MBN7774042.1 sulfatase-like hydrolase/transferase [Clostridium aminobutyricum]